MIKKVGKYNYRKYDKANKGFQVKEDNPKIFIATTTKIGEYLVDFFKGDVFFECYDGWIANTNVDIRINPKSYIDDLIEVKKNTLEYDYHYKYMMTLHGKLRRLDNIRKRCQAAEDRISIKTKNKFNKELEELDLFYLKEIFLKD